MGKTKRFLSIIILAFAVSVFSGCGDGGSGGTPSQTPPSGQQQVSIGISPTAPAAINPGGTTTLTVTVRNTSNTAFTVALSPDFGSYDISGNIVTYTAPATIEADTTVNLTVTSTADPTKSAPAVPIGIVLPLSTVITKALEAQGQSIVDSNLVSNMAVSVGVVVDGEVLFFNGGGGDRTITNRTIYEIASITKTFTATVIADLANKGDISLDDPLDKFFDFSIPGYDGRVITVFDLATHTSGLPTRTTNASGRINDGWTIAETRDYFRSFTPTIRPGSEYIYSNLGFGMLGYVIEQVTKKSFNQAVQSTITSKLGMSDTTTDLSRVDKARLAPPHNANGVPSYNMVLSSHMGAMGELKSTVYDIIKYMSAILGASETDPDLRAAFDTVFDAGLSWNNSSWNAQGHQFQMLEHSGGSGGYTSQLRLCPEINAGVIVLTNFSESNVYGIESRFMEIIVNEAVKRLK